MRGANSSGIVGAGSSFSLPRQQQVFLAADVGGTHARIGLVAPAPDRHVPDVLACHTYNCADYPGLDAIVRAFCEEHATSPRRLVLACAGYLHEGAIVNDNLSWPIVLATLQKTLTLDEINVLNDFEALAHAAAYIDDADIVPLHVPRSGRGIVEGPVVVVGPGTGLGVAVRLPGPHPVVLATEAGQIQLAARVGREQQVLCELALADTYVAYERVLSGPGLLQLYRALCRLERRPIVFDEPSAVTAAACAGEDELAVETLHLFCGWLGSFVGDLAMMYGATGGIYLAGGFLSRMTGFVQQSSFVSRFLDKGVMRPFQQTVPVHVVDHGQLGVIGAASWLMDRHARHQTVA